MPGIKSAQIPGVIIKPISKYTDARGWLMECFRKDEIPTELHPAMSYISMTLPGVTRGPHEHVTQTDYFCFLGPSTFRIYLWDNRKSSPTLGQKMTVDGGEKNPIIVIVPPGIVHAYQNIGQTNGIVLNYPNVLYAGQGKKEQVDEIRHEHDPDSPFKVT